MVHSHGEGGLLRWYRRWLLSSTSRVVDKIAQVGFEGERIEESRAKFSTKTEVSLLSKRQAHVWAEIVRTQDRYVLTRLQLK